MSSCVSGVGAYEYMEDLLSLDACRPPNKDRELPRGLQEIVTPLDWREWDKALARHPDQRFRKYLVDGIRSGFRLGFDYSKSCRGAPRNMSSAAAHAHIIRDYLAEECAEGRVAGPFDPGFSPGVQVSKFGVIPKSTPGKWRLIVDLSAPEGASVNDGISEEACSLSYVTVEDAARQVLRQGAGSLLGKVDVKSAYRVVPVHPDDRWLLGLQWEGALFIDKTLPFGLRSAPKIFTALADAAVWILRQEGVDYVIHYGDDFLLIGAPGTQECAQALATVRRVFRLLGLPIALDKLEGPVWCLTFLGIEIDTIAMELRLPLQKLRELQTLVGSWLECRGSCKRDELESLIGKLSHACKVVRPGKTFMRRLFELLTGTRRAHHHVRLNAATRSDLCWWATFMEGWNGASMVQEFGLRQASHECWTDASGRFGCGALWGMQWLQMEWPTSYVERCRSLREASITLKELLPVVLACAVWGKQWADSMVLLHCDNEGVVAVVNAGYSKVPAIMHLLRCLFFIRARYRVALRAVHIPGRCNTLADAISRNNLGVLFSQQPESVGRRCRIPQELWSLLVVEQPDWTSVAWARLFNRCL